VVIENKPEKIALWSGSCQHWLVDPGRLLVHLGTAGSDALSKWWLVTLAAVDRRSSICDASDYSVLVLDYRLQVFSLLKFHKKKKVLICYSGTQERNNPFTLHGNCMYSALYQFNMWFVLIKLVKNLNF